MARITLALASEEIGHIPNYTVWLNTPLQVQFNLSDSCSDYHLFFPNGTVVVNITKSHGSSVDGEERLVAFIIPSVTREFDNITMSIKAVSPHNPPVQTFYIYTQDFVGEVRNISNTTNCTHTFINWEQPNPKKLPIDNYTYVLMLNNSLIESKMILDHYVTFNFTTLKPNTPGYNFSVWANAPPGSSVKTSELIVAAQGPSVKYSYDIAMVHRAGSQQAVLLLTGLVNHGSCPSADPTVVLLYFSCGSYSPVVRPLPVHIASSNTTEVIQSDPIKAGHRNCNVTVISKNLSGKTVNDSHTFNTTDVQMFNATDNLGAINCSLMVAINSSVLNFMVNISDSSGRRFNSIHLSRKSNQRVVSNSSMVLPVDIYTLSLSVLTLSGFQYANFTTTVDISHSNYSTSTTTAADASTSTLSSTPTSAPITHGSVAIGWIAVAAIAVAVTAVIDTTPHNDTSTQLLPCTDKVIPAPISGIAILVVVSFVCIKRKSKGTRLNLQYTAVDHSAVEFIDMRRASPSLDEKSVNTEDEDLNTGDQDLQTPFAADKSSQQASSPSIVEDSQPPSIIIGNMRTSPFFMKAVLGKASTVPSKENKPLSLVKNNESRSSTTSLISTEGNKFTEESASSPQFTEDASPQEDSFSLQSTGSASSQHSGPSQPFTGCVSPQLSFVASSSIIDSLSKTKELVCHKTIQPNMMGATLILPSFDISKPEPATQQEAKTRQNLVLTAPAQGISTKKGLHELVAQSEGDSVSESASGTADKNARLPSTSSQYSKPPCHPEEQTTSTFSSRTADSETELLPTAEQVKKSYKKISRQKK